MPSFGSLASVDDYLPLIKRCASLDEAKQLHSEVARLGRDGSRYFGNSLVQMYGRCGSLEDARAAFDRIHKRNVYSWGMLVAAYAQNGHSRAGLKLLQEMDLEGERPDDVILTTVLSCVEDLEQGKLIHSRVISSGTMDPVLWTAVISMYGRCRQVEEAKFVFDSLAADSVFTWTVMITIYAQQGHCRDALECFKLMNCEGVRANEVTFVNVITACATLGALEQGRAYHVLASAAGFDRCLILSSALVNFYGKCGSVHEARDVFDRVQNKTKVIWNAMLSAYVQHGCYMEAMELYSSMQEPDVMALTSILVACRSLEAGKQIHATIVSRGLDSDRGVCNSLLNMYTRCGSVLDAKCVFDGMVNRNVVSWTAMISCYAQHGHGKEAFCTFVLMDLEGVKLNDITLTSVLHGCGSMGSEGLAAGKLVHETAVAGCPEIEMHVEVCNSLVDMYAKCGSFKCAEQAFQGMHWRNVVSWTNMMAAYTQHGHSECALALVKRMDLEGVKLDEVAISCILLACSTLLKVAEGRIMHARARASGVLSSATVGNALVYLYGVCGSLDEAESAFREVAPTSRDCGTWTALIAAYGQNGRRQEALTTFYEMNLDGLTPKDATFTSLLHACSHAGSPWVAIDHLRMMSEYHGIRPTAEHFGCLVDLFGRTGFVKEAEDLIANMPFEPDVVAWRSFLASLGRHKDKKNRDDKVSGILAANHAFQLQPKDSSPYLLLADISCV